MADPPAAAASAPTKSSGDRLASYFDNFFRGVIGIATLGASITFSKIVQTPVAPFHNYGFSAQSVQYLLATSWLLFVLTLAFVSFFASALSLWRPQAVAAFGNKEGRATKRMVLWAAIGAMTVLFSFLIGAFLIVGLVVVAYAGAVGWVAVGFTVFFGLLGFGCIIWQSPVEWPRWVVGGESGEQDGFEKHLQRSEAGGQRGSSADGLTRFPTRRPVQPYPQEADDRGRGYGRSTSGEHAAASRRYVRRDGGDDMGGYSRAGNAVTNEPGIFGQGGGLFMYDNGVREGLVMSRYD